ncbi:membrane protein FxsA [Bacillus mangrovi]|uniref:Membrane protein FxsA n=1 Tax=Metabacillus mangrovi TaxID=1491830 RepID=A0A7X2V3N5_9BACI|nr:FxsA family protein [Metabacillus mangrovi]MTH52872.1 membrane protein FxsA [Metabacillus mangrovi]
MKKIMLLLILIPAAELGILIWSGKTIGILPTILLILATGIGGALLARKQGLETWERARNAMNRGILPGEEIVDGMCILAGAIMLMTPGFVTDLAGFFLLLPFTRKKVKPFILRAVQRRMNRNRVTIIKS